MDLVMNRKIVLDEADFNWMWASLSDSGFMLIENISFGCLNKNHNTFPLDMNEIH